MKYEIGLTILRYNEATKKWYKDNGKWRMTVYLLSDKGCEVCGEKFFYCSGNSGRCCSLSCNTKYRNLVYGISPETAKKIGDSNRGNKKNISPEMQAHLSEIRRLNFLGDKNPMWKGGITAENERIYNSREYREWRKAVYERDDYTCQMCFTRGGKLNAHHIKPYAIYKDLAFEVSNGKTLCRSCHSVVTNEENIR